MGNTDIILSFFLSIGGAKKFFFFLRKVVLKSHIAIFSTTNPENHTAIVEEKPKNLVVELQCIVKNDYTL